MGNHVGWRPVARSNSGVESLRPDVDRRLANRELQVNIRVGRQEKRTQIGATIAAAAVGIA